MTSLQFGIFDWVEASQRTPGEVFAHKLDLAEAADRAGLHAYLIAEHQGTPLSINASPSVLLSAMFQRTRRLRAGALTFCLPWYNPYRFYNEVCMLDQLSGGRLELGVGRGVSPIESMIFGLKSIDEAAKFVPLANLALSPQCGFGSDVVGNLVSEDDQKRKLARVVETARQVWP